MEEIVILSIVISGNKTFLTSSFKTNSLLFIPFRKEILSSLVTVIPLKFESANNKFNKSSEKVARYVKSFLPSFKSLRYV